MLCPGFRMMLQHPGLGLGLGLGLSLGLGPSEISASALVPCLSPPGSLTLDDFTHFSPLVKEELRYTIQNKRLSSGMSSATTSCSDCSSEKPPEMQGVKREVHHTCLRSLTRAELPCRTSIWNLQSKHFIREIHDWSFKCSYLIIFVNDLFLTAFCGRSWSQETKTGKEQNRCSKVQEQEEGEDGLFTKGRVSQFLKKVQLSNQG